VGRGTVAKFLSVRFREIQARCIFGLSRANSNRLDSLFQRNVVPLDMVPLTRVGKAPYNPGVLPSSARQDFDPDALQVQVMRLFRT